ncbi:MAG: efflux RND transporter periplasmic adaptor subunit [Gammaproteobacteria bacterium]|jgi:RND family efflux transporter MFP subunit|nr:efflux RND transporter periplasmic adaptor subunit [Gammaproteobacteria bacterium]
MPRSSPRHFLAAALALLTLGPAGAADLETASVERRQSPREYRLDGVVEATNRSTISAQTSGQVAEVLFDVEDYVTKGTVVVRLKDTEHRARLDQAEAELEAAEARLVEATRDHERVRGVHDKGLTSKAELDRATATLHAAEARREAAAAAVTQAREQLDYTQVRAPYSGIVTERLVQVGETAQPGQRLMSGISLEQLRVVVDVPQNLIREVRTHGKARVQQPGNGWVDATRLTIFPYADPASNTFRVRLDIAPGTRDMFPGMLVKTAFVTGSRDELIVPERAVVQRSEVTGVYVVGADGGVALRHVRLGRNNEDGTVTVLSGLGLGERVALDPVAAGVRVKEAAKGKRNG